MELLLTGRHAHPLVTNVASSVIEMKEIKHPFARGIQARKGIEY
jgi:cob(I)alamin adenosyltransferase